MDKIWIVDIDGTLAIRKARSPYDWDRVGEDSPNYPIIHIASLLSQDKYSDGIFLISGRDISCKEETLAWMDKHGIIYREILMRPKKDFRPDEIVKQELYEKYIKGKYEVLAVFDDRSKVVDMWRNIGLTCLQVAPGKF